MDNLLHAFYTFFKIFQSSDACYSLDSKHGCLFLQKLVYKTNTKYDVTKSNAVSLIAGIENEIA